MYNELDVNYYTEYNSFFGFNANRYYAKNILNLCNSG